MQGRQAPSAILSINDCPSFDGMLEVTNLAPEKRIPC